MADVFTLGGSTLDLAANDALVTRWRERLGTIPTMTVQRRGIQPPPESSDTWMGQSFAWSNGGTTYFSGFIRSRSLRRADSGPGWIIDYQALGLRDLLDKFPLTDKTTGLDVSPFNCVQEDLANYNLARSGRTVGQILTDVLTSATNAANMTAYGVGNLTLSGGIYSLPAATVTDLAALTIVPQKPVYVTGEKFGGAIDGLLQQVAPNYRMWVKPDGTLRFLDLRTFSASTLTMGSDPIEPTEISRDISDCWQRIEVRGAPIAVMRIFKVSTGTLLENFAYPGQATNAAAKAAWHTTDFTGTAQTQDVGTCTMSSTTSITVTSSDTAKTWASNYWDQTSTGAKGVLNIENPVATGITSFWTARIVNNTALTAGGTSVLSIDPSNPAPVTTYTKYTISGQTSGPNLVWRKYQLADNSLWPLVVAQSTYPQPFINAGGGATVTSTPIGAVFWPQSGGSPPYNMFPLPFVYDGNGNVIFASPTYIVANNAAPADVWAMLPINTGPNQVFSPQNVGGVAQYAGDSHTIEGKQDTLVVTMPDWRDPGQASQVQAYADDLLDSVKNGVREGSVTYYGLYTPALSFGLALNIAGLKDDGTADTTGWEAAAIPVLEVEVEFSQGASDYVTRMSVSSRRAHYSAEMFLRPERTGMSVGFAADSDSYFYAVPGVGMRDSGTLAGGERYQQVEQAQKQLHDLTSSETSPFSYGRQGNNEPADFGGYDTPQEGSDEPGGE